MKYGYSLLALVALLAMVLAGCGGGSGGGGGGDGPVNVSITIEPTRVTGLVPGSTQTFTATVTGTTNTAVTWSIQEGSPAGGTIIQSGDNTAVYTAPSAWNTFHVVVTSVADPTKSATAEAQIGPPGPPD